MLLDLTGAQDCSEAHSAEVEKAALGSAVSLQPSNSLSEKIEDFSLDCFLKHLLYQRRGKDSRGEAGWRPPSFLGGEVSKSFSTLDMAGTVRVIYIGSGNSFKGLCVSACLHLTLQLHSRFCHLSLWFDSSANWFHWTHGCYLVLQAFVFLHPLMR